MLEKLKRVISSEIWCSLMREKTPMDGLAGGARVTLQNLIPSSQIPHGRTSICQEDVSILPHEDLDLL